MSSPAGRHSQGSRKQRRPLNPQRVLRAAVEFADKRGLLELSMRNLGQHVGVEAMSLYNHVASKDDLLDGMVDVVFAETPCPRQLRTGGQLCARAQLLCALRSLAIRGQLD
jgi:AcrR family transcriptional regulator